MASRGKLYHLQYQPYNCDHCGKEFIVNAGSSGCCSTECANAFKYKKYEPILEDLVRDYEWNGLSYRACAEKYGISRRVVENLFKYCGVKMRKREDVIRGVKSVQKLRALSGQANGWENVHGQAIQTELGI